MKRLTSGILILSFSSLLTDIAGEAVYSTLPIFLTSVLGANAVSLGLIEGIAESAVSILKLFSGICSDRLGTRKPLVFFGYLVASLARPLLGISQTWTQVLFVRFTDRVGKGIRTAPRDAWLAAMGSEKSYGLIYGFHRGMDHAGAIIGPCLASLFLLFYPNSFRPLFLWTLLPGLAATLLILFAKESAAHVDREPKPKFTWDTWKDIPPALKHFFFVLLFFSLGNSTDAFLLLRLKEGGMSVASLPLFWALFHVVKMLSSFASGPLCDRFGPKRLILIGWIIYACVYFGFAWMTQPLELIALLCLYGLFYGCTEAPEKVLIAKLSSKKTLGSSFGFYSLTVGIATLPASILFGALWQCYGIPTAFIFGASLALLAALLLVWTKCEPVSKSDGARSTFPPTCIG